MYARNKFVPRPEPPARKMAAARDSGRILQLEIAGKIRRTHGRQNENIERSAHIPDAEQALVAFTHSDSALAFVFGDSFHRDIGNRAFYICVVLTV